METTKDAKKIFIPLAIVLVVVALVMTGVYFLSQKNPVGVPSGTYDELAQCITDSGAIFYGAFWCPHCQNQKTAFGDSAELLPYIECSLPSGQGQTDECIAAGIQSYPTWEFADGARVNGEIKISSLAELTNCPMPASDQPTE